MRRRQIDDLEAIKQPKVTEVAAMIEDAAKRAAKTRDRFFGRLE